MKTNSLNLIFIFCFFSIKIIGQSNKINYDSLVIYKEYGDVCIFYSDNNQNIPKSERNKLIEISKKINSLNETIKKDICIILVPYNDYRKKIGIIRAKEISDYFVQKKVLKRFKISIVEYSDFEGKNQNKVCIQVRINN